MEKAVRQLNYDYASRQKEAVDSCNFCGAGSFALVTQEDRYGYEIGGTICRSCGLGFLSPRMSADEYAYFYQSVYRPLLQAHFSRPFDEVAIQELQKPYALRKSKILSPWINKRKWKSPRMLDVGGSTGLIAARLKEDLALSPTVLDPAPLELKEATKLGIETIEGFIETTEFSHQFEFIGMFQTIDHLLDVSSAIKKIHELLTDDGLFYVDVVDFVSAIQKQGRVSGAYKIDHPYYLPRRTTIAFLETCGFEILQEDFSPDNLHVGYLCQKAQGTGPSTLELVDSRAVDLFLEEIRKLPYA